MSDKAEVVLDIKNLDISFRSATDTVHAIRGVDLKLRRGETIALVGESGSDKSVTSRYKWLRHKQSRYKWLRHKKGGNG